MTELYPLIIFLKSKSKLGLHTSILLTSNLVDRGLAFGGSILIARHLGAADLGVLGPALVLSAIVSRICELGVPLVLQRETAKTSVCSSDLMATALGLRTILNLVMMAFLALYGAFVSGDSGAFLIVLLAGFASVFTGWTQLFSAMFAGLLKMQYVALVQITYRLAYVGGVLTVVVFDLGKNELLIALIGAAALQFGISVVIMQARFFTPNVAFGLKNFGVLVAQSWPLGIAALMTLTYDRVDTLIASWFLDKNAVGNYYAAYNLFTSVFIFSNAFNTTMFSVISRKTSLSNQSVGETYRSALIFMLATGGIASFVLFQSADWIIRLLYTAKYDMASSSLQFLSLAIVFVFMSSLGGVTLNALGLQKVTMIFVSVGVALNVVMNFVFIPLYGVIGAAGTTVATEVCVCLATLVYLARYFHRKINLNEMAEING